MDFLLGEEICGDGEEDDEQTRLYREGECIRIGQLGKFTQEVTSVRVRQDDEQQQRHTNKLPHPTRRGFRSILQLRINQRQFIIR